jgi:hypothetical protein
VDEMWRGVVAAAAALQAPPGIAERTAVVTVVRESSRTELPIGVLDPSAPDRAEWGVATGTAVDQRAPRSARRGWRIAAVVLGALLLLEISLSLAWPRDIPRWGFLPRPPEQSWNDGCNGHHRYYVRSGPFWGVDEVSTAIACPGR